MNKTDINAFSNVFDLIGNRWMLITAGNTEKINTMTASWGGMGVLWNKPVSFCVVRPQRYTLEFLEKADCYTLSFLPENYRSALSLLGSKSGRDCDKIALSGLTQFEIEPGCFTFKEADAVLCCKKLYAQFLTEESFIEKENIEKWYPAKDFHKLFAGEITSVYK